MHLPYSLGKTFLLSEKFYMGNILKPVRQINFFINLGQKELVSLFRGKTSTGVIVGIRKQGEDLHLECCIDPMGQINCHVKHNKQILWQEKVKPDEFSRSLSRELRDATYSWKNKDTVLAFNKRGIERLSYFPEPTTSTYNVDLPDIVKNYVGEIKTSRMVRRKLGNIRKNEFILGFPKGHGESLIVAIPNHIGIMISLDHNEGVLCALPWVKGAFEFVEIAQKKGFLDCAEEMTNNEIKSLLLDLEFNPPLHKY